LALIAAVGAVVAGPAGAAFGTTSTATAAIPRYDHVFLVINENHGLHNIIGNPAAPILNALAHDYGLATHYYGTSDPSEPNYVAMLGGSDFGINSDDPYWFPGHTVNAPNLLSQLEAAGRTWKGYFQGMPYDGFRGYCFPAKCNGIPDADTQYVAKHNGIVNFADMHTAANFANMMSYSQLATDLASGNVPNFSYIVGDECDDMHGAPPWCVDSSFNGDVDDNYLVSRGDAFVGQTVHAITSSPVWHTGHNAIVLTFDEGNGGPPGNGYVATIVVTNQGPRGLKDPTSYNHYSLLASLQKAYGLGCLLNSCTATPMTPLFSDHGLTTTPALPPPFVPAPNGTNKVSQMLQGTPGPKATLTCSGGWNVVPTPAFGSLDNDLAAVSASSSTDAWAVGEYYPPATPNVLADLGMHFDGTRWTAYALPDVGINENSLLAVSDPPSSLAWAVGYFMSADYKQRTLVEHWDGTTWKVVPSPNPAGTGSILYGVDALSDTNVWAVGGHQGATGIWHPLAEHWNGTAWTVVPMPDPGGGGNLLYAVSGSDANSLVAVGQQAGTAFPSKALVEGWNGSTWQILPAPTSTETLTPLAVTGTTAGYTLVGQAETNVVPNTTLVSTGTTSSATLAITPSSGSGENDLFGAAVSADGTTWAVGWYIDPATGNHKTLVLGSSNGGPWTLASSPNPSGNASDNGLAGVAAVPGGGVWAVGITGNSPGNPRPLALYHC
jgi:hypothetical protein